MTGPEFEAALRHKIDGKTKPLGALLTHSPRYRTSEGVHVGSTAPKLRTIHGVKCGNLLNLDCQHGGQAHNQPWTMFRFSGPNGVVVRIAIAYSD